MEEYHTDYESKETRSGAEDGVRRNTRIGEASVVREVGDKP